MQSLREHYNTMPGEAQGRLEDLMTADPEELADLYQYLGLMKPYPIMHDPLEDDLWICRSSMADLGEGPDPGPLPPPTLPLPKLK